MTYPAVYGPVYTSAPVTPPPYIAIPPAISWTALNGATVTALAPFAPDPLGPPQACPWRVPFSGLIERLPQQWDALLRGFTEASITDAWFAVNFTPQPILPTVILNDFPYAYWPLTDAAGSNLASNLAPGNLNPLTVTLSKYGAGGATNAFDVNSSALLGAQATNLIGTGFRITQGGGMWGQASVLNPGQGWSLDCTDSGFPPIAAGVTIEFWVQQTAAQADAALALSVYGSGAPASALEPTGLLFSFVIPAASGSAVNLFQPGEALFGTGIGDASSLTHVALTFTRTAWTAYSNGAQSAAGSWPTSLPPSFSRIAVADTALFEFTAPPLHGSSIALEGFAGHVAVFPAILPPARIAAHYQAGVTAFAGEPAHCRVERLLHAAGATGRRLILPETGADVTNVVSCQDMPGQPVSSSVASVTGDLLPGIFYIAPTGDMVLWSRQHAWDQPPKWVLGEDDWAGEYAYTGDITFDYDPTRVQDQVQLTQLDNQDVIIPSVTATETASQRQYGTISDLATGYLEGDAYQPLDYGPGLYDLANWLATTYRKPVLRLSQVTVDAAANPARWPFVLGASVGDVVQVNRRPPGSGGVVISVLGRITQTQRMLKFSMQGVTASVTCVIDPAPECDPLVLDSVEDGTLSGTDILGW